MFGIPMPAAPPAARTYGYTKNTSGAFAVNNPEGAKGAYVLLIAGGQTSSSAVRAGGCCLKYLTIPVGLVYTISGTVGGIGANSTAVFGGDSSVSLVANASGASSGGDINFSSVTDNGVGVNDYVNPFPAATLGKSGSASGYWDGSTFVFQRHYPGAVHIIWDY